MKCEGEKKKNQITEREPWKEDSDHSASTKQWNAINQFVSGCQIPLIEESRQRRGGVFRDKCIALSHGLLLFFFNSYTKIRWSPFYDVWCWSQNNNPPFPFIFPEKCFPHEESLVRNDDTCCCSLRIETEIFPWNLSILRQNDFFFNRLVTSTRRALRGSWSLKNLRRKQ